MRLRSLCVLAASVTLAALIGCQGGSNSKAPPKTSSKAPPSAGTTDPEAKIQASLDKMSPEDRKLAEAQRFCAVEPENRLGSMGVPMKITLQDEPVFLCCDACETRARAHADRTLAKVREFKERAAK